LIRKDNYHNGKIVNREPEEKSIASGAERNSGSEKEQSQRQIPGMDNVIV